MGSVSTAGCPKEKPENGAGVSGWLEGVCVELVDPNLKTGSDWEEGADVAVGGAPNPAKSGVLEGAEVAGWLV